VATVAEILVALAPELATTDPTRLNLVIDLAEIRTGQVYGAARPQAVALLAAHMLTLGNRSGGSAGAVTSESVGPLSISYGASGAEGDLGQTSYGVQLLELRESYVFSAMTRTMG
jgi:hypothetical protein